MTYEGYRYLNEKVSEVPQEKKEKDKTKKHTPDQEALSDIVKESGKRKISDKEADTLLDWSKEYEFPHRDDRGKEHWEGGNHIHIGPKHIPVQ